MSNAPTQANLLETDTARTVVPDPARDMTILTTEYYNLQSIRSSTISEANGRISIFLGAVSSVLIAIGFIGGRPEMQEVLLLAALVALPVLIFLGLATFIRVLESSIEDITALRGMVRIRHYFAEIAPHLAPYFVLPVNDDWIGMRRAFAVVLPRGQTLLTAAGVVSVITSVLIGVFAALLAAAFLLSPPAVCVLIAAIVFAIALYLHTYFQMRARRANGAPYSDALFPSPNAGERRVNRIS